MSSKWSAAIDSIRFEELSFGIEGHTLFQDVSFEFPMRTVVRIRSKSGGGKSSLLKLLAGFQEPTAGHYFINENDITEMSFEEFVPFTLKMGYCFEQGGLISNKTMRQNLMLPFFYHRQLSAQDADERVKRYCDLFGLTRVADLRPGMVSAGLRKACAVARSLIVEPQLLLLDNPTSALDEHGTSVLIDLVKAQQAAGTLKHIFVCSDDEDFMQHFEHKNIDIAESRLSVAEEETRKVA